MNLSHSKFKHMIGAFYGVSFSVLEKLEKNRMTISKTAMLVIIIVVSIIAVGSIVALMQERNKPTGIEIRMDKSGIKIEKN